MSLDILQEMKQWLDPASQIEPLWGKKAYQRKLNNITGLPGDGFPLLRFVWAPSVVRHLADGTRWSEYSVFNTKIDGIAISICPPRFSLEGRVMPDLARVGWNEETLGAMPPEGMYVQRLFLGEHDGVCCQEFADLKKAGKVKLGECFGKFRFPDEAVLGMVRQDWALMLKSGIDPSQPFSARECKLAWQIGEERAAEQKRQSDAMAEAQSWSTVADIAWAQKSKAVPRYQQTKSGVYTPISLGEI